MTHDISAGNFQGSLKGKKKRRYLAFMIVQSQVCINGSKIFFYSVENPFTPVTICLFAFNYVKILLLTKYDPSKMASLSGI